VQEEKQLALQVVFNFQPLLPTVGLCRKQQLNNLLCVMKSFPLWRWG
jgi:hypothetical protein